MKKNVFSKALALCLALVLCLGMMVGCGGKQLTPKELFDLSVTTQEQQIDDGVITMYGNTLDTLTSADGATVSAKITLGDAAKQLLSTSTGGQIKFDWLSDIGFSVGTKMDKGVSTDQVAISLNGKEIATVNAVLDTEAEKLYFSVPDVLSDALSLDLKSMLSQAPVSVDLKTLMDLKSWMPDQASLKSLFDKYTKLALENIKEVTKEDATIEAGGLSQKVSKLSTSITPEILKNTMTAFADAVEKDTELAGILDKVGKVFGFTSSDMLPEIVENLRNEEGTVTGNLDLVLYTDDKGNIYGMEATGTNPDTDTYTMKLYAPEQDGKTALSMETTNGLQTITMTGSGTKANNATNGTYTLAVDGAEILTIEEKTSDIEKAKKGLLNGSYTIKCGKALTDLMSSNPVASLLTQFSIQIDAAQADAKNATYAVTLLDNSGTKFASVDVEEKSGWSGDAGIATDKALDLTKEGAITDVFSNLNLSGLVEKLTGAGVPSELTQALQMLPMLFSSFTTTTPEE